MADFYLDADVDPSVVPLLEAKGHTVQTTRQISRLDAHDDEQLLMATDLGRLLVTHNKDYYLLLCRAWHRLSRRWGVKEDHAGVIVVPQAAVMPQTRSVSEIHSLVRQQQIWGQYAEYDLKWGWLLGL